MFLDHAQAKRLLDAAVGHLRPVLLMALTTGLRRLQRARAGMGAREPGSGPGRAHSKGGSEGWPWCCRRRRWTCCAPSSRYPEMRTGRVFRFGNPARSVHVPALRQPGLSRRPYHVGAPGVHDGRQSGRGVEHAQRQVAVPRSPAHVRIVPAGIGRRSQDGAGAAWACQHRDHGPVCPPHARAEGGGDRRGGGSA